MFIHLGGDKIIRTSELIAIFDISIEVSSKVSKQFVANAARLKNVETIGEEEPKSLIVAQGKLYYSPISSTTLKKRANHLLSD